MAMRRPAKATVSARRSAGSAGRSLATTWSLKRAMDPGGGKARVREGGQAEAREAGIGWWIVVG